MQLTSLSQVLTDEIMHVLRLDVALLCNISSFMVYLIAGSINLELHLDNFQLSDEWDSSTISIILLILLATSDGSWSIFEFYNCI